MRHRLAGVLKFFQNVPQFEARFLSGNASQRRIYFVEIYLNLRYILTKQLQDMGEHAIMCKIQVALIQMFLRGQYYE